MSSTTTTTTAAEEERIELSTLPHTQTYPPSPSQQHHSLPMMTAIVSRRLSMAVTGWTAGYLTGAPIAGYLLQAAGSSDGVKQGVEVSAGYFLCGGRGGGDGFGWVCVVCEVED
jgi:hypothetical protein